MSNANYQPLIEMAAEDIRFARRLYAYLSTHNPYVLEALGNPELHILAAGVDAVAALPDWKDKHDTGLPIAACIRVRAFILDGSYIHEWESALGLGEAIEALAAEPTPNGSES